MSQQEASYLPPVPEVGQGVWWYEAGCLGSGAHPAIVMALGNDSVNLAVFAPNIHNHWVRDGVRHVSDPRTRQAELRENGAWDYTDRDKRLYAALDDWRVLKAKLLASRGIKE